ncbi:uncharacterized protein BDFB_011030, partial [Asbolus verrucosus]
MFWWLHQTSADVPNYTDRPLVIWLQGGPGASSTGYGNFAELGPLDADLNPRNTTWINDVNVLFVDNPVGSGFSYVDSTSALTTTNRQIADDFVVLLQGFYEAVPDLKNTPLYIFCESYGGKMTAEIALVLDKAIKDGALDVNLVGVGLGDSWISPIDSVLTWGPYLLSVGAVDQNGYEQIQEMAEATKEAFDNGNYQVSTNLWGLTEGVIQTYTANIDFYNILTKISPGWIGKTRMIKPALNDDEDAKIDVIMNNEVKKALGLDVNWGVQSDDVFAALGEDFMKPVVEIVELLLNTTDIKVAVYNGQLDLIVDTPGTVKWVDELKFDGANNWKRAQRNSIVVNNIVEGYYKKVGNLAMYWVNRAGHMVPSDNPAAMKFILADVIDGFSRHGFGPTEQEWGYVTVREGAHMFWWLHHTSADGNYTDKPLVIWLQGGPGASSTGYGNFAEIGPLDADLNPRNTTWLRYANVLFVDNPVGSGFSYVDTLSALTTTNRQIADDFLVLLQEFFESVPELKNTSMYIFSESYGGKMAAEIALVLDQAIKNEVLSANLAGIGLGDSWISPIDSVLTWGSYLLNLGFVDQSGYEKIQEMAEATKAAFDNGEYGEATSSWSMTQYTVRMLTENVDIYNVMNKVSAGLRKVRQEKFVKSSLYTSEDVKIQKIMNEQVKQALGLDKEWGHQSGIVFVYLHEDFMKPVTDIVELLLNTTEIRVAVYNGQLDLIVDTPGTVKWIDKLKFDGCDQWKETPRNPLVVNNTVEGYYKRSENFAMYWVDRAGHMVPSENPAAMRYILEDMFNGFSFNN